MERAQSVDGDFGCIRHWINCVANTKVINTINASTKGVIEMANDARKHYRTAPINFTPLPKSDMSSLTRVSLPGRYGHQSELRFLFQARWQGTYDVPWCHWRSSTETLAATVGNRYQSTQTTMQSQTCQGSGVITGDKARQGRCHWIWPRCGRTGSSCENYV